MSSRDASHRPRRLPWTLWAGLIIVLGCEVLLFADVHLSHRGPLHTHAAVLAVKANSPNTALGHAARWTAVNFTALVWIGYLLLIEGILTAQTGASPVRCRPNHFALLCLASVLIWCLFDTINFYSIVAWRYIGMPAHLWQRLVGYFFAFATIVPGMLLSGQALLNVGALDWARGRPWPMPRWLPVLSLIAGQSMLIWPLLHPDPITNLTLWCAPVFLLDPVNYYLGRPSMWRDWSTGWYGRTVAAFAGGLICGLLWEFWNYWALTKWIYHLPFLGPLEHIRYFEMPVIGLLGFLPFGLACWVIWQTLRIALDGLAEPLKSERELV